MAALYTIRSSGFVDFKCGHKGYMVYMKDHMLICNLDMTRLIGIDDSLWAAKCSECLWETIQETLKD